MSRPPASSYVASTLPAACSRADREVSRSLRPVTLDVSVLESIQRLEHRVGKSVLPEMIEVFETHAASSLERLRAALAAGDVVVLRQVAHKLKSSARCLGLMRLGENCAALECLALTGRLVGCEALLASVEEEYGRAEVALGRFRVGGR